MVRFFDCSVSYKSEHTKQQSISTTDMTVVKPLNKVIHFARSSQLLSDITCGSTVYIPWPSTFYGMTRGVFSSTKQIGMEYIRFTFLWTLFVVHPLQDSCLFVKQFNCNLGMDRVPSDALPRPQVTVRCDIFFSLNSDITIQQFHTLCHGIQLLMNAITSRKRPKISQMLIFCTPVLSDSYDVWGGTHATKPLKTKDHLHHIHFLPYRDACKYVLCSTGKEIFIITDRSEQNK